MDKLSRVQYELVEITYLIPKLQRRNLWSLRMDK